MPSLTALWARLTTVVRDVFGPAPKPRPKPGPFVYGINLGGESLTVDGDSWQAYEDALRVGKLGVPGASVVRSSMVPEPYIERSARRMLGSGVFRPTPLELTLRLDNNDYWLVLWVFENHQSHWRSQTLRIDGTVRAKGVGDLDRRAWARYGPYPVQVTTGQLAISLDTGSDGAHAHLMGLSLYAAFR
jgi:hypothetical protein